MLQFWKDRFANIPGLLVYIQKFASNAQSGGIRLRPDQKIVITRDWEDPAVRMKDLCSVLQKLAEIAEQN